MRTGEIKMSLVTGNWHGGRWLVISKLNEGGVVQKKTRGFMKRYENGIEDRVLVHQMCWYYYDTVISRVRAIAVCALQSV